MEFLLSMFSNFYIETKEKRNIFIFSSNSSQLDRYCSEELNIHTVLRNIDSSQSFSLRQRNIKLTCIITGYVSRELWEEVYNLILQSNNLTEVIFLKTTKEYFPNSLLDHITMLNKLLIRIISIDDQNHFCLDYEFCNNIVQEESNDVEDDPLVKKTD